MKRLKRTESPVFVLLCVLYFQRQPIRFLLFKFKDKYGKELRCLNVLGKYQGPVVQN